MSEEKHQRMNHLNASYKDKGQTANLSFLSGKTRKMLFLKDWKKDLKTHYKTRVLQGLTREVRYVAHAHWTL